MRKPVLMQDYTYNLPQDRIAQHPCEPRDASKLLLYKSGLISDHTFRDLPDLLPAESTIFFNDAKVIPARIHLKTEKGAQIEVFLLRPYLTDYVGALNAVSHAEWECMIGNARKWKAEEILSTVSAEVKVTVTRTAANRVLLAWEGGQPFVNVLENIGKVPLPPYITHKPDSSDAERYQTVFAKTGGSVAAPTASLHFTKDVLNRLDARFVRQQHLTLHVSAGTFLPVKTADAREHPMHLEFFEIGKQEMEALFSAGFALAAGTTACRVMESLYWVAVRIYNGYANPQSVPGLVYESGDKEPEYAEIPKILTAWMEETGREKLYGDTSLMILPGYRFRVCRGLITNFHQPGSTLLLLIAAMTGKNWKEIYRHALENGYRFLSYGDASLLLP